MMASDNKPRDPNDAVHDGIHDVGAQQVAAIYAKAFLAVADNQRAAKDLVDELDSLVREAFQSNPAFERLLGSALIPPEEKLEILDRVFAGRISETLLVFLKVLAQHGRLDCLQPINRQVHTLYQRMQGHVEVTIRTARPLGEELQGEIVLQLTRQLQIQPELRMVADPSLLGGIVVSIGDTVFDGSVATRLTRLRANIVEKTIELIETDRNRFLTSADERI